MLLSEVPKQCPECDAKLFASMPKPSISKKAILVALSGIPLTGVWVLCYLMFSPTYIVPTGLGGVLIVFLVYCWPLCVTVICAKRFPEVIRAKCYKCNWGELFQIETPKIKKGGSQPPPLK